MILSEFWEREKVGDVAIHCNTKEKAKKLLEYFDKLGKTWHSGTHYVIKDFWDMYRNETCYTNKNLFCDIDRCTNKEAKIIEFEDVITHAKVVNNGLCYTHYIKWFNTNCPQFIKKYCNDRCKEGKEYLILKTGVHGDWKKTKLFVLLDEETDKIYLVAECGLKLIKEGEESQMNNVSKIIYKKVDYNMAAIPSNNLLTFRFNEERKSVTLYENGEKVKFVKCQPEDKFSWEIGLGVALYKYLNERAKLTKHVMYIKNLLDWKTFYTYIIALVLDFDTGKLARLNARVKRAKLYKEIKIND